MFFIPIGSMLYSHLHDFIINIVFFLSPSFKGVCQYLHVKLNVIISLALVNTLNALSILSIRYSSLMVMLFILLQSIMLFHLLFFFFTNNASELYAEVHTFLTTPFLYRSSVILSSVSSSLTLLWYCSMYISSLVLSCILWSSKNACLTRCMSSVNYGFQDCFLPLIICCY